MLKGLVSGLGADTRCNSWSKVVESMRGSGGKPGVGAREGVREGAEEEGDSKGLGVGRCAEGQRGPRLGLAPSASMWRGAGVGLMRDV